MRRNRYCGYLEQTNRGFVVAFDLQWRVVESRRIDRAEGAAKALAELVAEFKTQGWTAEGESRYGFLFMNRDAERILVEVTPRDPFDKNLQSFNPFKGK